MLYASKNSFQYQWASLKPTYEILETIVFSPPYSEMGIFFRSQFLQSYAFNFSASGGNLKSSL